MKVYIRCVGVNTRLGNNIMGHVEFHTEVWMCGEPLLDVICAVEADIIPFNNTASVVWGFMLSLWKQEENVIHCI